MACSPYIYTLSSCTRSSSRIDCLELSLQLEARVKGPQESIHEACLPIYSFHSRLDDAGRASCLPFTVPVALPLALTTRTLANGVRLIDHAPSTQSKWWLDGFPALYLYSNDQKPVTRTLEDGYSPC